MRPHRLSVTAFGAFAQTQQVCFDDLEGLFLLHGETGAGKTTLLDAIAFALYGRVPGERGKAKRLRSDHATAGVVTEVELEATIGGRRLMITRKPEQERPKRSGTGTTREPASVRLQERTASGGWEVKSTRAGEADAEIGDLMGMSAEQFFQVVLLPQGHFAQFLHADAEARARLLQKLFGTDRFRAVEDWLAQRRRTTAAEVADAAAEVDDLMARVSQVAGAPVPDQDAGQAAWAEGLAAAAVAGRDQTAAIAAARKLELDSALAEQTMAEQLADRQRRRGDALRRQAELTAAGPEITRLRAEAEAAARAAEVAAVLDEADRAAAAGSAAATARVHALAAIPAEILAQLRPPDSSGEAAPARGARVGGGVPGARCGRRGTCRGGAGAAGPARPVRRTAHAGGAGRQGGRGNGRGPRAGRGARSPARRGPGASGTPRRRPAGARRRPR